MKKRFLLFALFYTGLSLAAFAQPSKLKVVIIRHGEKPPDAMDMGNLSCKGENRALQLPPVLNGKFGTPAFIYVPSLDMGTKTSHARMFQTITPFAVKYGLAINSQFPENAATQVAQDILKKTGTVLVVWEHDNIPLIANALGVKDKKLKWAGNDFDSIWIITWDKTNKAVLTVDSEGLKPPDKCSF